MILLTVGTEKFSFHRLVEAFDELCAGPLKGVETFGQIGTSSLEPKNFAFERLLPFPKMRELTEGADLVVTHAGAGSMLLSLRSGHRPLVVPRQARFKEHVDDHQLQLATALADEGLVHSVTDLERLGAEIEAALSGAAGDAKQRPEPELARRLDELVQALETEKTKGSAT